MSATAERETELAALDYSNFPYIERRWLWEGYIPVGSVVLYAAAGGTGKGMLFCAVAARVVLGLPFPDEDQALRRDPGRVVWISGPGEDDQFEDMAPRLRAAIAVAVEEFGLDPQLAHEKTGAIRFVHDLSTWPGDDPVTLPADCARVLAEIEKVNKWSEKRGEPRVALVVADSLSAVLSSGYTIDSRQGAVKVMVKLGRLARRADVAFAVLHHLTKAKTANVAGSAGVLNSIRLAFVIEPAPEVDTVRVINPHKSNIATSLPVRYLIAGDGPMAHAAFVSADDTRAERVKAASAPDVPEPGTLRARVAAAAACPPGDDAPRDEPSPSVPRFRVTCRVQPAGDDREHAPEPLGNGYATREDAQEAACRDAGEVLAWHSARTAPGVEIAGCVRADGARACYAVSRLPVSPVPAYAPAPWPSPQEYDSEDS